MGHLLAVGLGDEVFALVSRNAGGVSIARVAPNEVATELEKGEGFDAILVGDAPDPLPLVRRCCAAAPLAPVLILSTKEHCARVRTALRFSPHITREVHCVAVDEPELDTRIHGFVRRGQLRAAAARMTTALNGKLAAAIPPLRTSAMVLDRLLEVAPIGIVVLDERGAVRVINRRATQLLGLDETRAIGTTLAAAVDDGTRVDRLLEACADQTNPHDAFELQRGDRVIRVEATVASLPRSVDGGRYLVVLEDSTERHALMTQLQHANRRKDEFLALLGHELRNPLAPIRMAVDLLNMRRFPEIERERAVIDRQLHHLTRLVDDLLDISRITQGRIDLERERRDLAEVIDLAVEATAPRVAERHQTLEVDVPRGTYWVDADVTRLDQVFSNLLTNAVRYSAPGTKIELAANAGEHHVEISVRDRGRGIEPALLPHIFEMFVQAKQGIDRAAGGLGLGLAIVRSLVELHDGTVSVTSEPGVGSEFVVRLPLASPAS